MGAGRVRLCAPCVVVYVRGPQTKGRTVSVRAVRVELAALVAGGDVDLREVADAGDLDVVGGLDEVGAGEGAVGGDAGAVAGLDAPGDLDALRVANDRVGAWLGRGKDAEVVYGVDCGGR